MALIEDPIDLKLDNDDDLVIEDGDLVFTRGLNAVAQAADIALDFFLGEWFADLDIGVPWLQRVLAYPYDDGLVVRGVCRDALLDDTGIIELTKLESEFDPGERGVTVRWRGRTEFGNVSGSSEVDL